VVSIIHTLINPLIIFWLALFLSGIFRIVNRIKIAKIFFLFSIAWFAIVSSSPIPQWLVFRMESTYTTFQPVDSLASPVFILVLGGGHSIAPDLTAADQLSGDALARLIEGIRLHRLIPGSKIVLSGSSISNRTTQAQMLGMAAIDLGVNSSDTLLSTRAFDTQAELANFKTRFGGVKNLILVTDALHMMRAIKYGRKEGLQPIPAPTNHLMKMDPLQSNFNFTPSTQKILFCQRLLHEYFGLIKFQWNL
jgi:uncharacterized SAM-binding protein YcdF (DUF218 family)